jgi:hypothetical protein
MRKKNRVRKSAINFPLSIIPCCILDFLFLKFKMSWIQLHIATWQAYTTREFQFLPDQIGNRTTPPCLLRNVKLGITPVMNYATKHYAMKMCWGAEIWLHHYWPWQWMELSGQLHALAALTPGKQSQYPLARRLGGPQSRSERYRPYKHFLPLPGITF